jgi:hypothetical protein
MTNPLNPNPRNFVVKSYRQFGAIYVAVINYPNCKNYEGNKVLVMLSNPNYMSMIDPHFAEGGTIIARFEPTKQGKSAAVKFAKTIAQDYYGAK